MATPIPKIIRLSTRTHKDNKTLFYAANQDTCEHARWKRWHSVVTSIEHYNKWKDIADIRYVVLKDMTSGDLEFLEKHNIIGSISVLTTSKALEIKPKEYWQQKQNVVFLDELLGAYPFIEKEWDGSDNDAVACITLLFSYNRVIDWQESTDRVVQFIELGIQHEVGKQPPMIYAITQYFVHSNSKRAREIRRCLMNNSVNPYIDKVVLLNEKDLSSEWSSMKGRSKIEQHIIGNRLRYCDLIKYTYENVPENVFVVFMNADIYLDETLLSLYSVNMKDRMFALLRWDTNENGSDVKLFGPHPDSQDTWIVSSDSVKSRTWNYSQFDYQLGRSGCDNRFTADMFANRFLISNPAHTIKTLHIHKTEIRDYVKSDIVPSKFYIYISPTPILDLNQVSSYTNSIDKGESDAFDVTIRCPKEANGVTWCTMIARHNRFEWTHGVPKKYVSKEPIYEWNKSFLSHCGIVHDRNTIFTGADIEKFMKNTDVPVTFDLTTPKWHVPCAIAVPFNMLSKFTNLDNFILYYMSKVLTILKRVAPENPYIIMPQFHTREAQNFMDESLVNNILNWSPSLSVYADKIIGYMPSMTEITKENIDVLRGAYKGWVREAVPNTCAVLYNTISDSKLVPFNMEFVDSVKKVLGDEWSVEAIDMNEVGSNAYNKLVGKQMCVFFTEEKQTDVWSKLWALPVGSRVLEFQNELKINGEFQHMAGAAGFDSWILTLHKGDMADMRGQAIKQFSEMVESWKPKNEVILP